MELLEIPDEYIQTIKNISYLEDEVINSLSNSLTKQLPFTSIQKLAVSIGKENSKLTSNQIIEILDFVISLFRLSEESGSDIYEVVVKLIELAKIYEDYQDFEEQDFERLKARLIKLVDEEGILKASYKAADIVYDNERIFLSSRILTDIRPVFGNSINSDPIAAGIVHLLKINFGKLDADEEFFVSMDENDLNMLIEQLNRAKAKSKILKELLKRSEVKYWGIDVIE